jgi:hypothetical protein
MNFEVIEPSTLLKSDHFQGVSTTAQSTNWLLVLQIIDQHHQQVALTMLIEMLRGSGFKLQKQPNFL